MKTYDATFFGKTKGALGIKSWITTTVKGETPEAARLNLYERYEHIQNLTLVDHLPVIETRPEGIEDHTQTEPLDTTDMTLAQVIKALGYTYKNRIFTLTIFDKQGQEIFKDIGAAAWHFLRERGDIK